MSEMANILTTSPSASNARRSWTKTRNPSGAHDVCCQNRRKGKHMHGSKWFLISRPKPFARYRLFCFPYAGGSASAFLPWEDLLPPQIELVAIPAPGRANRLDESLLTSVVGVAPRV